MTGNKEEIMFYIIVIIAAISAAPAFGQVENNLSALMSTKRLARVHWGSAERSCEVADHRQDAPTGFSV
jgi:hypothetical protein